MIGCWNGSRSSFERGPITSPSLLSKLRLTVSSGWHYPQTQQGTLSRCLYLVTLAVERQ